ncbi:hypothetical protein LguiB_032669 [Lonicera macranthoides]
MGGDMTRSVLGDVTNRVEKRGFSSILGYPIAKSGGGYCENAKHREDNSNFAKKACQKVENSEKEKPETECDVIANDKDTSINSLTKNFISASIFFSMSKDSNSSDRVFHLGNDNVDDTSSVLEVGDALRDSCVSIISLPESPCNRDFLDVGGKHQIDGVNLEFGQENTQNEQLVTGVVIEENDFSVENLDSSKCGSIDYSRLPESHESSERDMS